MFPTFNHANIRTDLDGMTFLDLEIQVLFNEQKVLFKHTFPATSNFQPKTDNRQQFGQDDQSDKK